MINNYLNPISCVLMFYRWYIDIAYTVPNSSILFSGEQNECSIDSVLSNKSMEWFQTYAVVSVQGSGNIKTFIKFLNLCNYFILSTFGISCLFLHKDCGNNKNGKRATEKMESHSAARVLLSKWMLTYSKWWNECTAHWKVVDRFF